MKIAALFAGIGGLELGLHEAGHETLLTCESWTPAVSVLAAQFPDTPNHLDIANLKSLPAKTDLLTAGFPCQDLSQAGMTAGIDGKRSGLHKGMSALPPNSDCESGCLLYRGHQWETSAIALATASAKSANFRDRAPCMKSSRRPLVISSWTPAPRRPLLQILLLLVAA